MSWDELMADALIALICLGLWAGVVAYSWALGKYHQAKNEGRWEE